LAAGAVGPSLADQIAAAATAPLASPPATGTFAGLAEAVKPAVINVSSEGRAGARSRVEEFFGGEGPQRMPRRSLGSGVIIDPSGVALTNAHVVEGGGQIEVTMLDGTKYPAKVVGTDKKTDLAVVRLPRSPRASSAPRPARSAPAPTTTFSRPTPPSTPGTAGGPW
jgi:S1-C subfamily serine protease